MDENRFERAMKEVQAILQQSLTERQVVFLERFLGEFHRLSKKLLEQVEVRKQVEKEANDQTNSD